MHCLAFRQGRALCDKTFQKRSGHHQTSKPGCALRFVASDVLDPKCDDGSNVPKPLRVCIQVISAEVWQRVDGNVLDTKC